MPSTVEDSAATLVELEGGAFGTILSSWATRVRRDDLLTLQVDGTAGSAVAGLHRCHVQIDGADAGDRAFQRDEGHRRRLSQRLERSRRRSPRYCNPYRVGWESFLRHVAAGAPLQSDSAPAFATSRSPKACHRSMAERSWIDVSAADGGG